MPDATIIPLRPKGTGSADWWSGQIDWCVETRETLLTTVWRPNVKAYTDELSAPRPHGIRVNVQFEKVEQKRHQLLWRLPALKLRATPRTIRDANLTPNQPRDLKKAVSIFREYLSYLIGPRHANLLPTMEEIIFDVLCPSGIGFIKVGYERYEDGQVEIPTGRQIEDPEFQQPIGNVLGLMQAPLIPELALTPNVVAERYYGSRVSPANGLWPQDFMRSDFTRSPWLGHDFWQTSEQLAYRGWERSGSAGAGSGENDDKHRISELERKGQRNEQSLCREIFYYGHEIDPDNCPNPDKIRRLVFVKGVPIPVVHEDFTDQRFDPRGRFIGGLRTLPIKVLTLRYVSDAAVPPSDCSVIRKTADQLAEYLTQMIEHRRRAVPIRGINIDELTDERMKDKLRNAILNGEYFPDIFTSGVSIDKLLSVFAPPSYPQDNFAAFNILMNNVNRALALGANQSSVKEAGGTTATEIASIERATASRLGAEAEKVVSVFFMSVVEAFGDLVQLHADKDDYVEVLGEGGAKSVEVMNKETVRGEFLYEAIPNSAMQPDAAADRDLALNRFNLVINNPFTNQKEVLRDTVEEMGGDPDRLVTDPPPAQPEKPRISLAINGKDLDPTAPQYQNVVSLLTVAGIPAKMQPTAGPVTSPEEPTGPAEVVDRERLRMAEADAADQRAGGLVGVGVGGN